jgi:hypothetical protein
MKYSGYAVIGPTKSGKSTFSMLLADSDTSKIFHVMQPLRDLLYMAKDGETTDKRTERDELVEYTKLLRKHAGPYAIMNIAKHMTMNREGMIIDGVRRLSEVKYLLNNNYYLIYVETSKVLRDKRIHEAGEAPENLPFEKEVEKLRAFCHKTVYGDIPVVMTVEEILTPDVKELKPPDIVLQ